MPADLALRPTRWPEHRPRIDRRILLTLATILLFALGLILLSRVFLASLTPTAATVSAHQRVVDLSDLAPGQVRRINWEGQEVLVLHRTPAQIAWLAAQGSPPRDKKPVMGRLPEVLQNPYRSLTPSYLVVSVWPSERQGQRVLRLSYAARICHDFQASGSPFRATLPGGEEVPLPGGFFCPDDRELIYDPAGNSLVSYVAPLDIPPHHFAGKQLILGWPWGEPGIEP